MIFLQVRNVFNEHTFVGLGYDTVLKPLTKVASGRKSHLDRHTWREYVDYSLCRKGLFPGSCKSPVGINRRLGSLRWSTLLTGVMSLTFRIVLGRLSWRHVESARRAPIIGMTINSEQCTSSVASTMIQRRRHFSLLLFRNV